MDGKITILSGRYLLKDIVGEGRQGYVYKAKDIFENEDVAIKVSKEIDGSVLDREIEVMTLINNADNGDHLFVKMKDHFTIEQRIFVVYELLNNDLDNHLSKISSGMNMKNIKKVGKELCRALWKLESVSENEGVIHGDLKPDNIMFVGCRAKIVDFGHAQFTSDSHRYYPIQAPGYRAPEVILTLPYSKPADMWSLGCIFLEMLTGEIFFNASNLKDYVDRIISIIGMPPDAMIRKSKNWNAFFAVDEKLNYRPKNKKIIPKSVSLRDTLAMKKGIIKRYWNPTFNKQLDLLVDLVLQMLVWSPTKRISAENALKHQFFKIKF